MRNSLLGFLLLFALQHVSGQDILTTKDKKQRNVKVIEQTDKSVKFKMADYADGPILKISSRQIRKIEYKNGYTDLMGYQNPRKERPLGIGAGYAAEMTGGGFLYTANLDYFVIPQIDLEMNLGTSDLSGGLYYSGGVRIHLNSKYSVHKLTPFTGMLGGAYYGDGVIQIPAGVSYLTPLGISASLSVNEMVSFKSWQATFIELRATWRFKL